MGSPQLSRRALLRASLPVGLACLGAPLLMGCERGKVPPGRQLVDLWFSYGGNNRVVLEAMVARYNQAQKQIWVRPVFQGDYFENLAKLRTAAAAGSVPAISHVVGEVVPYLQEAGVLEPLDAYPGASSLDLVPALAQPGTWAQQSSKPLVALPFNRSTPIAYLNAKHFSDQKLSHPRTWDELREQAAKLSGVFHGKARWGFDCPVDWWFWAAMVGQAGGAIVEPSGEVSLGGEAGVKALEFLYELINAGGRKTGAGRDYNAWEVVNQNFLSGRTSMIWTSTAFLKYFEKNASFPVIAAPLPAGVQHAVPTGGTFFVLMKQAKTPEKQAGWEFLRWMMQPAQAKEWATLTGYMPVNQSAVRELEAEGYYKQHPNDRVAYDQLGVAFKWPWSVDLFRIQREIVQPKLEYSVLGGHDPRRTLHDARALAARQLHRAQSGRSAP